MSQDAVGYTGIFAKGFGMAPKLIMRDARIPPMSKLIYCYMASYAGAGMTAYPAVTTITHDLSMCKDRTTNIWSL